MTNETRIVEVLIEGDYFRYYRLPRYQDLKLCQKFCAYCDAYLKEAFFADVPTYVQYHCLIDAVREAFKTEIEAIVSESGKRDDFTFEWSIRRYELFVERETYMVSAEFSWDHTRMTYENDFNYCSGSIGRAYVDGNTMFCFVDPDDAVLFKMRI